MASHLPSPPASPSISPEAVDTDTEPLSERLDSLLINYLSLLDTYTTLRADLSKTLSSGFFALAQANRNANSTLGPGRRYGEEGFDDRMKAAKVVKISPGKKTEGDAQEESESRDSDRDDILHVVQSARVEHSRLDAPPEQEAKQKRRPEEQASAQDYEQARSQLSGIDHTATFSVIPSPPPPPRNPLNWYGILIPPALRTTQASFTTAISATVPDLLTTVSAIKHTETEIWSLRAELGIVND